MKIVILDGLALFQQDIPRNAFQAFGEIDFYEKTNPDEIPLRDPAATVLVTNKCLVNEKALQHFKEVKLVLVAATGYNSVDTLACKNRGIQVSNVPAYGTYSVAQHTLALLLAWSNRVEQHNRSVQAGEWIQNDWAYSLSPLNEWAGKKMGIIGMGNIGKCFANMAASLGMSIYYHHTKDLGLPNYTFLSKKELAQTCDVISLHCPLNPQTDQIINEEFISWMPEHAVLINSSRGGLVNNMALANALKENRIKAALLDVLDQEPPPQKHPLIGISNAFITPHNAWLSIEARTRIIQSLTLTLEGFLEGKAINQVN
ncbi:NAD(P)-dependent oxidoreductase [Aquirufa rosea]|uniref:D-2-hydroxyacid dehydrogenase n=1 Tax=Aquirufa rosea TaxID=2509241 RepID=A0A4Q1C391_9BACT|nr:NAD(P)-dependent oxidoreductase [Aquirufa rosea]RXK52571.1 D-2-hydroxyacid dehydrogenase [Aquirufa rosea]